MCLCVHACVRVGFTGSLCSAMHYRHEHHYQCRGNSPSKRILLLIVGARSLSFKGLFLTCYRTKQTKSTRQRYVAVVPVDYCII